jgi:thiamine-phosphate pyrophosphorylase
MIVISNPVSVPNEINDIHALFAEGLTLFHVRKPDFSEAEMKGFVSKIQLDFRELLVLHNHHQLAEAFGINRIHFSENERAKRPSISGNFQKPVRYKTILSTSVHSIKDFNRLEKEFDYAFLSPIYPSISKPDYASEINHFEAIKLRTNFSTKLVALGGISSDNIQQIIENGFDDVALLGTIWNSNNPIQNFKKCQQIAHSF